jgi:hypothetical protein
MRLDHLPQLEGTTLSGRTVLFPRDLPGAGLVLVVGFTHAARHDVGDWKAALAARGTSYLSLPTASVDTHPGDLASVANAMRAHVPSGTWDQVIQIHQGGEALQRCFGWQADVFAKVLRVTGEGRVLARHDSGPFSQEAFTAVLG